MKEVVKRGILKNLAETERILLEHKDYEALKNLSDEAIEDVALHKDLDMISVTVMIYSLYKVVTCMLPKNKDEFLKSLRQARKALQNSKFRVYNQNIRKLFAIIKECSPKVKEHLQDVMQAARIKKGTVLLGKGLSIGQAAGLMGLSNWDLQQYAGRTPALSAPHEAIKATKRLENALRLFQ